MTQTFLKIVATLEARPNKASLVRALLLPAVKVFRAQPGRCGYVLLEGRKHPGLLCQNLSKSLIVNPRNSVISFSTNR